MSKKNHPIVVTQMLIRKPVAEVFQAFIDPTITTNFWFTKSSGKLKTGKTVTWEWEMYGVSTEVVVKEIIKNEKIKIEWDDPATMVDFEFNAFSNEATYVVIKNHGFREKGNELIEVIKDNTGGFTTVLDGLKAWLEHGINLHLIADKYPQKIDPDDCNPDPLGRIESHNGVFKESEIRSILQYYGHQIEPLP